MTRFKATFFGVKMMKDHIEPMIIDHFKNNNKLFNMQELNDEILNIEEYIKLI